MRIRPATLGQASRISGVSPADIGILMVWLKRGSGGEPGKEELTFKVEARSARRSLWPLTCRCAALRLRSLSDENILQHADRRGRYRLGAARPRRGGAGERVKAVVHDSVVTLSEVQLMTLPAEQVLAHQYRGSRSYFKRRCRTPVMTAWIS